MSIPLPSLPTASHTKILSLNTQFLKTDSVQAVHRIGIPCLDTQGGSLRSFCNSPNLCQGRRAEANHRELSRFRAPGTAVEVAEDADSKVMG